MKETIKEVQCEPNIRRFTLKNIVKFSAITTLAFSFGYIHYRYVSYLFENDRNFSYLSEMEREMSFRTEMGFYYSYYKTLVEERPLIAGFSKIMYDRLVEYPKDVNAFNRFNIHPEVVIGAFYRYLEPWLNATRQCHMVDRGEGLAPVESCVGIGQPIMFYLEAIWWLAGLAVAGLFLHAAALSESILGGVLAVAQYFANHAECTRVQWAPNERENLALPLLLLQAWLVSLQLRLTDKERRTTFQLQVSIFILNCLCLLFWQFSQFIFLTQTAIFFVMEQLRIIDVKALCIFLHSHFCGLHMAVLLLQGNDMLKSSLFTSFFLVVSAYSLFCSSFRIKVLSRLDLFVESWLVILRISIVVLSSFYLKNLISDILEVQEDTHVWEILHSKFTDFKNFHTLLYTCSEVFDFLPWSSVWSMTVSFLIPMAYFSVVNVCNYWTCVAYTDSIMKETEVVSTEKEKDDDTDDSGIENNAEVKEKKQILNVKDNETKDVYIKFLKSLKIDAAIFYNISQMVVYGTMAYLVMRLKLLFSTQMCVVSSLMMNTKYYVIPKKYMKYVPILWLLSISPLIQNMVENVSHEMSHVGEFSDIAQEELLEWIRSETGSGAAFAGSMPVSAAVMLVTRRPIVTHPHYEHLEARQRAYSVYKMYGRFSPQELYQELSTLRVTYLIVETKYCYGRSSKGCSFEDIWAVETGAGAAGAESRPALCHTLLSEPVDHFYQVFRNHQYAVFRLHDYSVRYMPRSFDT